jgi:UDP-glucose 4-epimerase
MRTLVTGGAGFIGSHLVGALVGDGHEVVVLDDLSTGSRDNVADGARLVVGSITDPDAVAEAVAGCEVVFHEAAIKTVARSVEHPLETDRVNIGGTLQVLLSSRDAGVRRVVYASSSSVYGGALVRPTPESTPVMPRSPYAVSKLTGEYYCRVASELYGLETVTLRYFNVYGPRQRPDSRYAAVIPLFISRLMAGHPVEVHGDGLQSRDFTFISDTVAANLLAATAPADVCSGKIFNIATADEHSLLDLIATIEDVLKVSAVAHHVEPRAGDVRHSRADITFASQALEYRPEVTLADGLERTVAWLSGR